MRVFARMFPLTEVGMSMANQLRNKYATVPIDQCPATLRRWMMDS